MPQGLSAAEMSDAEQAYLHYLRDPGHFMELYLNPDEWASSQEVALLDVYLQYSTLHTSVNKLIPSLFGDQSSLIAARTHAARGEWAEAYGYAQAAIQAGGLALPFSSAALREQVQRVVNSMDATGLPPPGVRQGGARDGAGSWVQGLHVNRAEVLPVRPLGYYTETDVWAGTGARGTFRLVMGSAGEVYLTVNHYQVGSYVRIR
jgi:guanyl-specific ribonuclease Sa